MTQASLACDAHVGRGRDLPFWADCLVHMPASCFLQDLLLLPLPRRRHHARTYVKRSRKSKGKVSTHLCLIACRSKSAALEEFVLLSWEAVVAMLAVRGARQLFADDEGGREEVARVGLAGAVVELACSVDSVGMALDDFCLRWPGRAKGGRPARLEGGGREVLAWRSWERRRFRSGEALGWRSTLAGMGGER